MIQQTSQITPGASDWISTTLAATASGLNAWLNYKSVKETNQMNREIVEDQQKYNLDMWKLMNEYNSPKEQMKRLKEAGLSPLLAYGHLQNSTTQPPIAPSLKYEAPKYDFSQLINILTNIGSIMLNNKLINEQIKSLQVENEFKKQKLIEESQIRINQIKNSEIDAEEKKKQIDLLNEQIKNLQQQTFLNENILYLKIEELREEIKNKKLQNDILEITKKFQATKDYTEIQKLREEIKLLEEQTENEEEKEKLNEIKRLH